MKINEKIDLDEWYNVKKGQKFLGGKNVDIKLAMPGTVYAGPERLIIGHGTHFRLVFSEMTEIQCSQDASVKRDPERTVINDGEVYTNEDKRPEMSPAEQMVTRALREMKRQKREIERERDEVQRLREEAEGDTEDGSETNAEAETEETVETTETTEETTT